MQIDRSVAVRNTLRVSGGTGGVAKHSGIAFVDVRPVKRRRRRGSDHLLLPENPHGVGRCCGGRTADDDDVLDRRCVWQQSRKQRNQVLGDDHYAVPSVVDDVDEPVVVQAQVQGV